jgi:electron transport complex protein RnfC
MDGVKVLIINGAECEPFITSDHRTMLEDAQNVIDGALAVMKYLEIDECYIGIEDNKQDAIDNFESLFAEQGIDNVMHTFPLRASYPKGAERVLIYEVTGKTCNAGVLPADLGCIVSNVTSIAFLGQYLKDGIPLIKKRMTVDGDAVSQPKNIVAPIGTSIYDVVAFCGGYKCPPTKILMGGPMMGRAVFSDSMPIVKNNNAILVFSKEQAWIPEETACINCGRCLEVCPAANATLNEEERFSPIELVKLNSLDSYNRTQHLFSHTTLCGACDCVCPVKIPLVKLLLFEMQVSNTVSKNSRAKQLFNIFRKRGNLNKFNNSFFRFFFVKRFLGKNKSLSRYFSGQNGDFFNITFEPPYEENPNEILKNSDIE